MSKSIQNSFTQGARGANGANGVNGAQGYQGNQGVIGNQGIIGYQGYQGNQGLGGSTGNSTVISVYNNSTPGSFSVTVPTNSNSALISCVGGGGG